MTMALPRLIDWPHNRDEARFLLRWLLSLASRSNAFEGRVPWIVLSATDRMEAHLRPGCRVFEYGPGGSTLWFSDRRCQVVSVEHDPQWHRRVMSRLSREERERITCLLEEPRPRDPGDGENHRFGSEDVQYDGLSFERYVRSIEQFPEVQFDAVLVDGRARSACLSVAWPRVKIGGLLVLDNSDRERYQEAIRQMPTTGRRDYHGPAAYSRWYWTTTVWEKLSSQE
jgi:hypothetical protein